MIVMVMVKIWGKRSAYESPSKDRDTKMFQWVQWVSLLIGSESQISLKL